MRADLGLGPCDFVGANELPCAAEGCSDVVTTMLVMHAAWRTEVLRAERPLASAVPHDFLRQIAG